MTDSHMAAKNIVSKYTLYAAGAGLVPIPVLDLAALAAVNLAMIQDITKHFGADFSEEWGKSTIAALLAGMTATSVAKSAGAMSMLRVIPLVGQAVASVSMSVFGSAATNIVGRVFVAHFAAGMTERTAGEGIVGEVKRAEWGAFQANGARQGARPLGHQRPQDLARGDIGGADSMHGQPERMIDLVSGEPGPPATVPVRIIGCNSPPSPHHAQGCGATPMHGPVTTQRESCSPITSFVKVLLTGSTMPES